MTLPQMIETYKELGYGGLLIVLIILIGRFLVKSNQACYDKYEKHMKQNRDEMKELTLQMFKIVDKNTTATTALQKTMTDIYIKKLSGIQ